MPNGYSTRVVIKLVYFRFSVHLFLWHSRKLCSSVETCFLYVCSTFTIRGICVCSGMFHTPPKPTNDGAQICFGLIVCMGQALDSSCSCLRTRLLFSQCATSPVSVTPYFSKCIFSKCPVSYHSLTPIVRCYGRVNARIREISRVQCTTC